MTPEDAKAYVARRRAELPDLHPLPFVNQMIAELWLFHQFAVNMDFTNIPLECVAIVQDEIIFVVARRFNFVEFYMRAVGQAA